MILVDSSVWINHLRQGDDKLVSLLEENQVLMHPMVVGEIACGNLKNREDILSSLHQLPRISSASDTEVLALIDGQQLMGKGIGYIDAHLLASVFLHAGARLWTRDKSLAVVSTNLHLTH